MKQVNGTQEKKEKEIVEWYVKNEPIRDIIAAHGLVGYGQLYTILDKYDVPRRLNSKTHVHPDQKPTPNAPTKPAREWFLIDECAAIIGMSTADIEWFIHKEMVYTDTPPNTKITLVYLPSLMEVTENKGIDGKRAKQLLQEAWVHLEKVARQQAIDITDVKFICKSIRAFFEANGWELD